MKKIYEYLEDGEWVKWGHPKKGKQYGFFGTLEKGKYGEMAWGHDATIRRGNSQKELFAWLHNTVPLPFWGDMGIKLISKTLNTNIK